MSNTSNSTSSPLLQTVIQHFPVVPSYVVALSVVGGFVGTIMVLYMVLIFISENIKNKQKVNIIEKQVENNGEIENIREEAFKVDHLHLSDEKPHHATPGPSPSIFSRGDIILDVFENDCSQIDKNACNFSDADAAEQVGALEIFEDNLCSLNTNFGLRAPPRESMKMALFLESLGTPPPQGLSPKWDSNISTSYLDVSVFSHPTSSTSWSSKHTSPHTSTFTSRVVPVQSRYNYPTISPSCMIPSYRVEYADREDDHQWIKEFMKDAFNYIRPIPLLSVLPGDDVDCTAGGTEAPEEEENAGVKEGQWRDRLYKRKGINLTTTTRENRTLRSLNVHERRKSSRQSQQIAGRGIIDAEDLNLLDENDENIDTEKKFKPIRQVTTTAAVTGRVTRSKAANVKVVAADSKAKLKQEVTTKKQKSFKVADKKVGASFAPDNFEFKLNIPLQPTLAKC